MRLGWKSRSEVIVDPVEMPTEVRRVGEALYNRTDCPSCGGILDPLPKAKKRCPSCGEPIFVRTGPDGVKHLLREADLEAHEAWWAESQAALEEERVNREAERTSQDALDSYARLGVRFVEMSKALPDACPACRAVGERRFALTDAPQIPIPGCGNSYCRCAYLPVVD